MKSLANEFRVICDDGFKRLGFKRKGNNYTRVVNDVYQSFRLTECRTGNRCTVEFGIVPLCMKLEADRMSDGIGFYNLREFEVGEVSTITADYGICWYYGTDSGGGVLSCAREMASYMASYLIPLFERANCCETALSELRRLEEKLYEIRTEINRMCGENVAPQISPENGLSLLDGSKYWMAIKNGEYDYALKCREAALENAVRIYEWSLTTDSMCVENVQKLKKLVENLEREIILLAENLSSLVALIEENEAYSLENYESLWNSA